ncbi:MAG: AAA family ATPase [Myxococcota bacterium]
MLQQLTVSGLGPHKDFTAQFNPTGRTVVTGPSESGKTSILEAITFCLWGRSWGGKFRPEAIHDGMTKAVVEMVLDSGRRIRRSVTRGRSQKRSITIGEETEEYSTEAKFLDALGDLGRNVDTLRVVLAPMEWVPMVGGNARPFRDLLTSILPDADVGGEVERLMVEAGQELKDGETELSEKEVMAKRLAARKARDEAQGRLDAADERLATLRANEPTLDEAEAVDPEVLEAATQWAEYDRKVGASDLRTAAEEALRRWSESRTALGDEPAWDEAFTGADQRLQQAQWAASQAMQVYQQAYGQYQTVATQLQQFQGIDPTICPTCRRPGWEAGQQYVQQLQTFQIQVQATFDDANTKYQASNQELQVASEFAAQAREATLKRASWRDQLKRLGDEPALPDVPDDAPARPQVPRPDPDLLTKAQATLRASATFEGAFSQWKADVETAKATVERESQRQADAAREFERFSALLDAVRAAPSGVAERQALALGDLGPVTLEFGDNPAVEVLIDKRPWWLASRGRQVVADMWLRAAIRRVLEREWIPLIVDNIQDVGGQPLPDIDGPVVLLQTTDGKGLSVRRK